MSQSEISRLYEILVDSLRAKIRVGVEIPSCAQAVVIAVCASRQATVRGDFDVAVVLGELARGISDESHRGSLITASAWPLCSDQVFTHVIRLLPTKPVAAMLARNITSDHCKVTCELLVDFCRAPLVAFPEALGALNNVASLTNDIMTMHLLLAPNCEPPGRFIERVTSFELEGNFLDLLICVAHDLPYTMAFLAPLVPELLLAAPPGAVRPLKTPYKYWLQFVRQCLDLSGKEALFQGSQVDHLPAGFT